MERLQRGRPLRVKFGADPSAPDLHLGHTVVLTKLRQFQDLGHTVIFLIGDFTGMIGDPTGQSETRKALTATRCAPTPRPIGAGVQDPRPERTEVRFNSEWMDRMSAADMVRLCAHYTVARMLERDDFAKRYAGAARRSASTSSCIRSSRGTTRWRCARTSRWVAPISASTCSSAARSRRPTASRRRWC